MNKYAQQIKVSIQRKSSAEYFRGSFGVHLTQFLLSLFIRNRIHFGDEFVFEHEFISSNMHLCNVATLLDMTIKKITVEADSSTYAEGLSVGFACLLAAFSIGMRIMIVQICLRANQINEHCTFARFHLHWCDFSDAHLISCRSTHFYLCIFSSFFFLQKIGIQLTRQWYQIRMPIFVFTMAQGCCCWCFHCFLLPFLKIHLISNSTFLHINPLNTFHISDWSVKIPFRFNPFHFHSSLINTKSSLNSVRTI